MNQIQGSPQVETASSSSKAKKKARQATNDGQSRTCLPLSEKVPGGGGTPLYGLYRYVPRNRVGFLEVLDP